MDLPALEAARAAMARHAWRQAFDLLTEADKDTPLEPDDLGALAEAAWWSGRLDDCIAARERAFKAFMDAGQPRPAALQALSLFDDYLAKRATAIAGGWLQRAERLLESEPVGVEHGHLAVQHAHMALMSGELEKALVESDRALQIGTSTGDRDVQAFGVMLKGNILVNQGQVVEGLKLLDEATIAAVGGELEPFTAGIVYCLAISTSAGLGDYDKAGQWTEASLRWCERQSISGFPGMCRVHRAEIMRLRGSWVEAEQEARRALTELKDFNADFAAAGFYEVGEIRLRMGDLDGAQEAFRQAHELGREPLPGLAMLRLAEGDSGSAFSAMARALDDGGMAPLYRARLLPAMVEIAIVHGDLERARASVEELGIIIETYDSSALQATYLSCLGALELAQGNIAAASKGLRASWKLWNQSDLPYEAARTRLIYGTALRAEGDESAALLEIGAAKAVFERLGAVLDSRRAMEMLGEDTHGMPKASAPVARIVKTFMFTDIVGSTKLAEAMGEDPWGKLLRWHDRTLRELFEKHHGEEVKHLGDGFFAAFNEPNDAVECAVEIQRTLSAHGEAAGFAPDVRIGLHCTEATLKGSDYEGKGVHEAARIGAQARGGEVLVSQTVIDNAAIRFPMSEPRTVTLKGLSEPMTVAVVEFGSA